MQRRTPWGTATWAFVAGVAWFIAGIVAVLAVERHQIVGQPVHNKATVTWVIVVWIIGLIVCSVIWLLASRTGGARKL